ncbi:GTPase Era [Acrasis kona]|uniref:GTPase Era n=1 Tax=Acrasis kona TaxID=1008807 RepID=A0AAW2YK87_9EUKA
MTRWCSREVSFHSLFTNESLKNNYLKFLCTFHRQAKFLFLTDVRALKGSLKLEDARAIVRNYFTEGSRYFIDTPTEQRRRILNWSFRAEQDRSTVELLDILEDMHR